MEQALRRLILKAVDQQIVVNCTSQ